MTGHKRKLATALVCGAAAICPACSSPAPPRQQQETTSPKTAPVRIVQFYSSLAAVPRGRSLLLCYGVESAASVRIEPTVGQVSPSPNRCIEVSPGRDTKYTLTATGADGSTAAAEVPVRVLPPAPTPEQTPAAEEMIHMFLATATEVDAGQAATVCYDVRGADALSLEPGNQPASPGKRCLVVRPQRTTTYKLTARGGATTETRELTIRVR